MSISLKVLKKMKTVEKVIIHSLDISLYLVSILHEGEEHYIVDQHGDPVKSHNKLKLMALFAKITCDQFVLRQESAYDEMVGFSSSPGRNTLEVPIGNARLGVIDNKSI